MKKLILLAAMIYLGTAAAFSQAKAPTIMVVPSDTWCNKNGCMMEFNNQGAIQLVPDYEKAVMTNSELMLAISKMGELMSNYGFPLVDLSASLRQLRTQMAEESVTMNSSGDNLAESPVDKLKKVARADIWIMLDYFENRVGPNKSITFNIQGIDTYSSKQIAAASGTSKPMMGVETPVMLANGVIDYMPGFTEQLQNHFDDLFAKGREVSVVCKRWSGSEYDFESEFDGEELGVLIEMWLEDNTVDGRFSTDVATENQMVFNQVRIPMLNERGRGLDTRTWVRDLNRWLKDKYGVDSKISIEGLGKAIVTIGEK